MAETWRVERHGGRTHDRWFMIVSGPEWIVRDFYTAAQALIHRGSLRLMRPPGEIVDTYTIHKPGYRRVPQ